MTHKRFVMYTCFWRISMVETRTWMRLMQSKSNREGDLCGTTTNSLRAAQLAERNKGWWFLLGCVGCVSRKRCSVPERRSRLDAKAWCIMGATLPMFAKRTWWRRAFGHDRLDNKVSPLLGAALGDASDRNWSNKWHFVFLYDDHDNDAFGYPAKFHRRIESLVASTGQCPSADSRESIWIDCRITQIGPCWSSIWTVWCMACSTTEPNLRSHGCRGIETVRHQCSVWCEKLRCTDAIFSRKHRLDKWDIIARGIEADARCRTASNWIVSSWRVVIHGNI